MKRTWKSYPELKIFEEGYNRDYVYEKRNNIPILSTTLNNKKDSDWFKTNLDLGKKSGYIGGTPRPLLTMRGAIKFNMWKE